MEIYIDRPPRIQPILPLEEKEIPKPPDQQDEGYARLIQVSLPLVTIIGYVLIGTLGGGGRNPWFMIPMALSVVASVAFSIYSYRKEKQRRDEIQRAYADHLTELSREMHMYHDMQRRFYRYNYSDTDHLARIVDNARLEALASERSLRSEARLWERRVTDDDFGVVRLGIGTLPSTVTYTLNDAESLDNPLVREAMKLADDSRQVSDIPVIISLRQPVIENAEAEGQAEEQEAQAGRTPVTHALGIAGQKEDVYQFTRAILGHYAVFHAPMDAKLYVLGVADSKREWNWAYSLPHTQADESDRLLCFVDPIAAVQPDRTFSDSAESELEKFLEGLRKTLAQRKIQLQDREGQERTSTPTYPFLLVVVDLLSAVYQKDSPMSLASLEVDAAISILLEEGAKLGAAIIFLVPERSKVPSRCNAVVEIQKNYSKINDQGVRTQEIFFRYTEVGLNTFRYVGTADIVPALESIKSLAEQLAQMKIRESAGANLVRTVPFLDLMGTKSLWDLEQDARQKWQVSKQAGHSNWLRAKVGMMAGNKARTLVFSAKHDGVHGMVAGSTGSGKSELLITLITGLAATYDPSVLNFVLVDYKGGGAFDGLKDLPHCVDLITNLEKDGVTRMFTAIDSELKRRQALNVQTNTKHVVEYREKGLHETHKPYPFLFIVIDEFAEMIADRSEFRDQLESITRLGRAQGVSLVLAAQRPSGVTDQMRSNIKFRISLRVETTGESREMLRRSEAAFLPGDIPGRGYLQVGNDEIELIQVAYTGEKYTGLDYFDPAKDQEPPELYKAIVDMLQRVAKEEDVATQHAPWPKFLPAKLTLTTPLLIAPAPDLEPITSDRYLMDADKQSITLGQRWDDQLTLNPAVSKWLAGQCAWLETQLAWDKYALRPVVGLLDDPYEAKHLPLVIDLTRGHVVIFGASGWGKTTFIRSLVTSLVVTHSPNQLHVYLLDLGGRSLSVFEKFPHVGVVVTPDREGYEEQVEQLMREIDDIVRDRRDKLSNAGVDDIYHYNRKSPQNPLPAIVVAVDNFVEFKETFGNENENVESVLDRFVTLARQAKPFGVHFIISVNQLNDLSSKIYSLFTERLTLRLAEQNDYRAIVGGHVPELGEISGRGYIRVGRQPLSFQVALPVGAIDDQDQLTQTEADQIRAIGQAMSDYVEQNKAYYQLPFRIDPLPRSSSYRQVLAESLNLKLDETFLDDLLEATRELWERNASAEYADWLNVVLGITSGNRKRALQLEAKKDGVHGMIAGGTGSGKSELLMTLIVGLALNYPPDILNFVLVDYKGGGAFKPFETLPHCVDIVTNLNKAAVDRMFTAINAEIRRRQALNVKTVTKDIVEYRQKGLHLTREPYPHLFVIIDEYAEMIDHNPEYRAELESITRVGRAQGVNLILASQRPKGVTDQMRANIKLRLCLRVEDADTSRELLRRPDAASLPNGVPGRGYLQTGNENLELVQVSYTGEPQPDRSDGDIVWPDRALTKTDQADEETPKFFNAVVTMTNKLWGERAVRKPWPHFLPKNFSLQSPLQDAQTNRSFILNPAVTDWLNGETTSLWPGATWNETAMQPVVGLVDDPADARQVPLCFDLSQNHLAIFGDSGSGKTVLLRTLMVSLAATHSPNELHLYVLDLGGRNFNSLEKLPHVGAVIYADDEKFEEKMSRLLDKLTQMTRERQQLWSEVNVSSLAGYNQRHPSQSLPAVVVIIDNFAELQENHESLIENTLVPLVRRSLNVGITFVVSGNVPNNLPGKLYNLFSERVTFRQTNADYYRDIVARGAIEIEDVPGRGYVRQGKHPLLFQAAQPLGLLDETGRDILEEAAELRRLAEQMDHHLQQITWRTKPDPIVVLPEIVTLRTMLDQAGKSKPGQLQAVLGQAGDLTPAQFDLKRMGPHFAVVGPPLSGKTTALYNWVLSLAYRHPPERVQFVLIDLQKKFVTYGGKRTLEDLPHVLTTVSELEQLEPLVTNLKRESELLASQGGERELFVIVDNFDDFSEEIERHHRAISQELATLARRYGADGLHFILAGMLDGTSDLKRRVISTNYGLGLGTEQALGVLRVMRTPAELRAKELPVGRGYRVKSGQPTLLQVASPYSMNGEAKMIDTLSEDTQQVTEALDQWVDEISAAYPNRQAKWSTMLKQARSGPQPGQSNAKRLPEERVTTFLKGLWCLHQVESGLPLGAAEDIVNRMGLEDILRDLENAQANGKS